MDWNGIQSASLAAVRTVLQQSSFDVLWEHQWEAGYLPANSHVRLALVQDEVIGSHIRYEVSGGNIIEKQWQDKVLTIQYTVSTLNQTLSASAPSIASKIRAGFLLTPVQELFTGVGLAPEEPGPVFVNDAVSDKQRWTSEANFEVRFNAVELIQLASWSGTTVEAVEYSGSLSSSIDGPPYLITGYISSAYHPSGVAPPASRAALMDEGLMYFNWESTKTQNFNFVFTDNLGFGTRPHAVVLNMWNDVSNSGGVIYHGVNYNSASLTVETSAPFSGTLRYRAIRSNISPNYPALVTSSLQPSSGIVSASANHLNLSGLTGNPAVSWESPFRALPSQPTEFWVTHWSLDNPTGIPVVTTNGFDTDSASGSIAAQLVLDDNVAPGQFDHIAFLSGS